MTQIGKLRKRVQYWRDLNSTIKLIGSLCIISGILLFFQFFSETTTQDFHDDNGRFSINRLFELSFLLIPLLSVVLGFVMVKFKHYPDDLKRQCKKLNMEL